MCYPKPGPRCSSHARAALQKSYKSYQVAKEAGSERLAAAARREYQQAKWDFLSTPQGLRHLDSLRQDAIAHNDNLQVKKIVELRKKAELAREAQIKSLSNLERFRHLDFKQLRTSINQEDELTDQRSLKRGTDAYSHDPHAHRTKPIQKIKTVLGPRCRVKGCTSSRHAQSEVCSNHWHQIAENTNKGDQNVPSIEAYKALLRVRSPELTEDDIDDLTLQEATRRVNLRIAALDGKIKADDEPKLVRSF